MVVRVALYDENERGFEKEPSKSRWFDLYPARRTKLFELFLDGGRLDERYSQREQAVMFLKSISTDSKFTYTDILQ